MSLRTRPIVTNPRVFVSRPNAKPQVRVGPSLRHYLTTPTILVEWRSVKVPLCLALRRTTQRRQVRGHARLVLRSEDLNDELPHAKHADLVEDISLGDPLRCWCDVQFLGYFCR